MRKIKDNDLLLALAAADATLEEIRTLTSWIAELETAANLELTQVSARYETRLAPIKEQLQQKGKFLVNIMKANKRIIFQEEDVVNLENGSLIHSREPKVTIPRDALAKAEEQGFDHVIKIAKSLDREAVEKWTDEKLLLIGAERKPVEKFTYDLKKEKESAPCSQK